MRIVTYRRERELRSALEVAGRVVDCELPAREIGCADEHWWRSVTGLLGADERIGELEAVASEMSSEAPCVHEVRLAPPIPDPQKIICIGLNYPSHVGEARRIDGAPDGPPATPILFAKFATSLIGHEETIVIPRASSQIDWEAELAVVIGRRARNLAAADALRHVGGYTAFNDVSARDLQLAGSQWTAGKAPDTFAPCGPAVVTADAVSDPQQIEIEARLNGETMQSDSTRSMIFTVAELIEYISSLITLVPGDLIATGTPAGVGVARDPQVWMRPGDRIEVELEGIGLLSNPVAAEA
jgi:acylpyruvate hydrolase